MRASRTRPSHPAPCPGDRPAARRLSSLATWHALGAWVVAMAAWQPSQALERALLVGVSHYPHLPGKQLAGPVNDLRLMRHTLQRLGLKPEHITELSEPGGPRAWPTRAHILAALAELAERARPGDWTVVYFSGHGSQVPQTRVAPGAYAEPDQLDEVFLPRDTSAWDPRQRRVQGAITDDELGAAVARITAKGAQVWAIFDTCHAGDMLREAQAAMDDPPVWRYPQSVTPNAPRPNLRRVFPPYSCNSIA